MLAIWWSDATLLERRDDGEVSLGKPGDVRSVLHRHDVLHPRGAASFHDRFEGF